MNIDHGLMNVWIEGDGITRAVALLLLAMSLASWLVIVAKALNVLSVRKQALRIEAFWHSANMHDAIKSLGSEENNPFREVATKGQQALTHLKTGAAQTELSQQLDTSDWVTRGLQNAIDDEVGKLQSGLAILASVGSTSPFVGLFGTVWGIYHALMQIGMAGQATIDKVAGPIGEALIMTALGLAVAIPAVLGYNALVRANKSIVARMNRFAHDLHALLVTGSRVKTGT
ncbi:MAG: MotA/TolQ/ExbB proton channel family protein [Betaproteobacteria bacterium]|jgi:biopolymer transport protein ExbB|nr:MotA/TolQ/ExbB proton channel family protein [Betaproteobacteria bacterium]